MKEFDRIIGYSDVKKELIQIADVLRNGDVYAKLGIKAPIGLMLYGQPGVGKTLMADCLIRASGRPAVICRKNKPDGEFVNEISSAFEKAAAMAPSVLLLDDIDKFANEDDRHRDAEEYVTVQSCIDEIRGKNVFILATANDIRKLPHSLHRSGRFDREIEVEAPEGKDAVDIISHYLEGKSIADDIDREYIAKLMTGSSCAKLETILNEAGLYAGYDREDKINMKHFMRAYLRDRFGSSDIDDDDDDFCTDISDSSKRISQVTYHEAGHAVASEILEPGSVTFVTVRNSGRGSVGGFTSYYNTGRYMPLEKTKVRIISAIAGAAAVEQKFGIISTGARRDFEQANRMMRDLIGEECICGFGLMDVYGWGSNSEALKEKQETATALEIQKYFIKAKEAVTANMEFLDKLAKALSEKKLLTADEIQQIKSTCRIVPVSF